MARTTTDRISFLGINAEACYERAPWKGEILRCLSLPGAMIEFVGDRPGHDFMYSLSCDKIDRLGWKPRVGFEEGLQKTIDWYKGSQWW